MENNPVLEEVRRLEEKDNIIDFKLAKENRLAFDNKEPPAGPNWLSKLNEGCIFLVVDQASPFQYLLHRFYLCHKFDSTAYILYHQTKDSEEEIWVIPEEFSRRFKLNTILQEKD